MFLKLLATNPIILRLAELALSPHLRLKDRGANQHNCFSFDYPHIRQTFSSYSIKNILFQILVPLVYTLLNLHPMDTTVLAPASESLPFVIEQNTKKTPEQY
jgi:hypothetical protein